MQALALMIRKFYDEL